jgi:hypothetical protein
MSFRLFIYYCAFYGGCAAYLGWVAGRLTSPSFEVTGALDNAAEAALKGMCLGLLVALGLGLVDALWSFSLRQFGQVLARVVVATVVGALGGLIGGLIGGLAFEWIKQEWVRVLGWTITGLLIGASLGVFDVLVRVLQGQDLRSARRKIRNGTLGGTFGGALGGVLFLYAKGAWTGLFHDKPADELWSPSAIGFVILGLCIGLSIGLAQVIFREAWVRVEEGFRGGRELILSRPESLIGRAEGCDIGLFGDAGVERTHARIMLQGTDYLLVDAGTPGGTYLNGQRISQPTPLHAGDIIRLGNSILRFGMRQRARA